MKTCPVCAAKAFDDARICYGCMHSFEAAAQRKKEPSPLDNTTLDWLAPENLRPLADTSETNWISGNDTPPWIESYKGEVDLAEAEIIQEDLLYERTLRDEVAEIKDQSGRLLSCDEADYEVPLEVYAESWSGDDCETQFNTIVRSTCNASDNVLCASGVNILNKCEALDATSILNQSAQEVVVRLEFGWADQGRAAPIRVEAHQDWLSRTPVGVLAATG